MDFCCTRTNRRLISFPFVMIWMQLDNKFLSTLSYKHNLSPRKQKRKGLSVAWDKQNHWYYAKTAHIDKSILARSAFIPCDDAKIYALKALGRVLTIIGYAMGFVFVFLTIMLTNDKQNKKMLALLIFAICPVLSLSFLCLSWLLAQFWCQRRHGTKASQQEFN